MALQIVKKPATAITTVTNKESGKVVTEQHHQEDLPQGEVVASKPLAYIRVGTSLTINLGKFNSVKVSCYVELPAALHELDEVFEYGREWMNSKMEAMVADVSPDEPAQD